MSASVCFKQNQTGPVHGVSDYTDVLILRMYFQTCIGCNIYVKCCTRARTSTLGVKNMCAAVGQETCAALFGIHGFIGCDTVGAFSGQGKLKALKLLVRNTTCQ